MQHSLGSSRGGYQESLREKDVATEKKPQSQERGSSALHQQCLPDEQPQRQVLSKDDSPKPKACSQESVVRQSSGQNLEDKDLPREALPIQAAPGNALPASFVTSQRRQRRGATPERREPDTKSSAVSQGPGSSSSHLARQKFANGQSSQERLPAAVAPQKSTREFPEPSRQHRLIRGGSPHREASHTKSRTDSKEEEESCSLQDERRHRSPISALALFAIAVVVIGILIYVTARRIIARPRSVKTHIKSCNNTDCLRHAAAIKMAWNNSVDPCEDFYHFVCGSWAAEKEHRRMDDLIATSQDIALAELRFNRQAPSKARKFFLSCIQAREDIQSNLDALKTWASSMGMIWPRNQSQAHVVTRHPLDLLLDLAINWRMGLLSVHTTTHRGKNQRVLIIEPVIGAWSALLDKEGLMSLVDQHVELLDAQKPLYWHEWNETVAAMRAITAGTHAKSAPDEVACVVSNLDDLTKGLRKGIWLEFINVHFAPELTFDENDPVIVYDMSTMTNVGNVFDNTSLDALSEVFSWLVIETYLGVIVRPYREYDAGDKAWLTETNCLLHTNSLLGLLSVQQYHQRKFPTWRRESVDSFLKHIGTTWALNVEHAPWIDRHSRRLALKKVHALDTVLWPADEFYDRESSEALYAPFPDMDKPFTANLIETALARRRLVNDSHYADVYSTQMAVSPDLVAYKYHLNEVHVALAALNPPAYYDVGMYAMTYGGLGSLYAKEVSKIYDSTGRLLNANGELLVSPFGEESTEYKEKLRCNATGRLPTYDYFVHVAGLETSYEAYRVAVPHDMRDYDYRLQALGEYDSDQVFFMTYCHMLCAPQADHRAEEYCNVPLSNFRPFADAFHCPAGSYMSPGKRCTLFAAEKKQEVKYA